MSYDIHVDRWCKDGELEHVKLKSRHDISGGMYCLGGTDEAWLNITYNYADTFYRLWPKHDPACEHKDDPRGIRILYGKSARDAVKILDEAIPKLSGEPCTDYWKGTEGNAKKALEDLRKLIVRAISDYPDDDLVISGD